MATKKKATRKKRRNAPKTASAAPRKRRKKATTKRNPTRRKEEAAKHTRAGAKRAKRRTRPSAKKPAGGRKRNGTRRRKQTPKVLRRTKHNPARRIRRKRNSEQPTIEAGYENFHGRPPEHITEIPIRSGLPTELYELGRLVDIEVKTVAGEYEVIEFVPESENPHRKKNPRKKRRRNGDYPLRLAATADGGQLYIVGAKAGLPLEDLGLADYLPKDKITVGAIEAITYESEKGFDGFKTEWYRHSFEDDGDELPILIYDTRAQGFEISGGSYQIEAPGIVR